ncbi:hypothetical protein MUN82_01685 [Hymenobacter aerilatus]|uniref:DUF4270 family protein n=1 Tax=Hymenobacter aerilatus TaxID=2932251 RepID=A0A8T9SWN9_9BACT|nr:hypothetical protein [Hymenobacter aerilatus]UOR05821.1 hypothetical protein MUN82_01685 [Hymenobacter aerilatus]
MLYSTYFTLRRTLPVVACLAVALLAGCEKEPYDELYTVQQDAGFGSLRGLVTTATKFAPGETVPVLVSYNQQDNLRDITVFQVINRQDSAVVGTYPASGALDATTQAFSQSVPYTVPSALANKTPVRVDVTLNFTNGSKQLRRFSYTVASAPTLKFGATPATYRNGLTANAQSPGDLIGYSIVMNEGGISTVPAAGSSATLFKNIDSLVYYARVGTQAPVRQGVLRTPTAGVAATRAVDVRVPAGAQGQPITFLFSAFAQTQRVDLSSATLNIVAPTTLATTQRGMVSFGTGASPDSLAYNLKLARNEPAASAATTKDLFVSGVANSSVTLTAGNNTRYYKVPATQVAAGFYTQATANAVGNLLYQNTNTAELGAATAGDVYAVRVRGTGEVILLRILGVKTGATGATSRVRFEYRML